MVIGVENSKWKEIPTRTTSFVVESLFCKSDRNEETESTTKQRRLQEKSINERMNTEELFDVVHGTDVVSCYEKDVPQRERKGE